MQITVSFLQPDIDKHVQYEKNAKSVHVHCQKLKGLIKHDELPYGIVSTDRVCYQHGCSQIDDQRVQKQE